MKKLSLSLLAGALVLTMAGCAQNNQQLRDAQYQQMGDQMLYNIGVVDAEQQRLKIEADARAAEEAKAEKARADQRARAERARQQANAKVAADKRARQKKLEAYADRERELEIRLRELDVEAREAQVKNLVTSETLAKEKVELELEALRAKIREEKARAE